MTYALILALQSVALLALITIGVGLGTSLLVMVGWILALLGMAIHGAAGTLWRKARSAS